MLHYNYNQNKHYSKSPSSLLEEIISLIEVKTNHKRKIYGYGYMLRCPAHEDKNPSLSIGEGRDRRVLMKCFKGCSAKDICASIGKTMRNLFPFRS
jgi:DNA primase